MSEKREKYLANRLKCDVSAIDKKEYRKLN